MHTVKFVNFNHKSMDVNWVEVEKKKVIDPIFHEILDKFKNVFEGHGKLQDYQVTLSIDKT